LPAWGMERTLRGAALLAVLPAAAVALRAFRTSIPSRRQAGGAAARAAAIVLHPKALEPAIHSSGGFLYGSNFARARTFGEFREAALSEPLLYYADGLSATVTVKDGAAGRHLQINGKTDASTGADRLTQLVIGYVPLMLNPWANRVLVIGLGTGMTASALAQSARVRAVQIVELEPRVGEAAALFDSANGGLLRDPRVSLVFEDARRFLSGDGDAYDIITAEPSNPWVSGVASLYTRESFLKAGRRLAAQGVFCQWMHAYRMSEDDFRSVLSTFASAFPYVLLFRAGSTFDYLMIGSNESWPGAASARALVDESPALREGIAGLQLEDSPRGSARIDWPFDLLAGEFVLGDREFRRYAAGAPLNTDDRPILEFSAPKHLFTSEEQQVYASVESARREEFPGDVFPDKITMDLKKVQTAAAAASLSLQDLPRALRLLRAAVDRDPADSRAGTDYARALLRAGRADEAETLLLAVVARNPRFAQACFHLADLHAMRGEIATALSWAERGLRLEPNDPMANISAGSLYLGVGKKDAARRAFERALETRTLDEATRRRLEASLAHWR
ncbi:MAG: tetratricopeptide repeat protein, partial [Elusimicrobiota bacterium]